MLTLVEDAYIHARFKGVDYGIVVVDVDPLFCVVIPLDSDCTRSVRIMKTVDASGEVSWSSIVPKGIAEEDANIWIGAAVAGLTFAKESYELNKD